MSTKESAKFRYKNYLTSLEVAESNVNEGIFDKLLSFLGSDADDASLGDLEGDLDSFKKIILKLKEKNISDDKIINLVKKALSEVGSANVGKPGTTKPTSQEKGGGESAGGDSKPDSDKAKATTASTDESDITGDLEDAISESVYEALGNVPKLKDDRKRRNKVTDAMTKLSMDNRDKLVDAKSIKKLISDKYPTFTPKTLDLITGAIVKATEQAEQEPEKPSKPEAGAEKTELAKPLTRQEKINLQLKAYKVKDEEKKNKLTAAIRSGDRKELEKAQIETGIKLESIESDSNMINERWDQIAGLN